MSVLITLSDEQDKCAEKIGRDRQNNAELRGANPSNLIASGLQLHIWGAKAEYAAAIYLESEVCTNLYTIEQYHDPAYKDTRGTDLLCGVEVRSISKSWGDLIIKGKDWDYIPYLLVYNDRHSRDYDLIGWCYGYEGKKIEYWYDVGGYGRPAYFIPQNMLHPIHTLKQILTENSKYGLSFF